MVKKKGKLVGNIFFGVIAAVIIGLVAVLFIGRTQNKAVFLFGKSAVWIMTDSMEEVIPARSYILVEKVNPSSIKTGDIVMFYSDDPLLKGNLNTHRVIKIIGDNSEFVTKGDNNPGQDNYTAKSDKIVGRYVRTLPVVTALFRFFLTKYGFIIILLVFAALTLAVSLPDIIRNQKKRNNEKESQKNAEMQRLLEEEIEKISKQNENMK